MTALRLRLRWQGLLVATGLITGAVLGLWIFGLSGLARLPELVPATGAGGTVLARLAGGAPLPTDLLAMACVAAIALLCLRDAALDWGDRRRLARMREAAGLSGRPGRR